MPRSSNRAFEIICDLDVNTAIDKIITAVCRVLNCDRATLFIVEGKDDIGRMIARTSGNRLSHAGFDDGPIGERRKSWFKRINRGLKQQGAAPLSMKTCKPRHIVELYRRGTAEDRAAAEAARDSTNPHYGSGSTADGRAAAAAAVAR